MARFCDPRANAPRASSHSQPAWLTLTDLGRIYGISAVQCGRVLSAAALRKADGQPTPAALRSGCASQRQPHLSHGATLWHRDHCHAAFAAAGLVALQRATLVQQWTDLLSALNEGSASISTSAAQMAEEMPRDLIEPVNAALRAQHCSFQVDAGGRPRHRDQSKRRRDERGTARPRPPAGG